MMDTKVCTKCGVEKPLSEFHKDKKGKYGRYGKCKSCCLEYARQYREENREKAIEYSRRYREENPEKTKRSVLRSRAKNPEKVKEQQKRWQNANQGKVRQYNRNWRRNNPEKVLKAQIRYLERIINSQGTHTAIEVKAIYKGQGGKCWYCGCQLEDEYHVDHFIPLDKGGSNDVGNLRIACPSCNLSKGAKDPHEWSGRLL